MTDPDAPFRVLLLTDLEEPLGPTVVGSAGVLAWELAQALAEVATSLGGFAVDMVARRGSQQVLPLVTADPDELAPAPPSECERDARQDALYMQMILAGLFRGYDVVHSLVPLVASMQLLVSMGHRVCQTVTARPSHLAVRVAQVLPPDRFHAVALGSQGPDPMRAVPPPVDLTRFALVESPREDHLVWDGSGGTDAHALAVEAGAAVGLPVHTLAQGDHATVVAHAAALLHLPDRPAPVDVMWPVRSLAVGTPVISWPDATLERYCDQPGLATFLPLGDALALAEAIDSLACRREDRRRRRAQALAWSGPRAIASRHREIYRFLLRR